MLGRLVALQAASPAAFTDEEIRTNIIGLVVGFVPTIATATTFAVDALLDRPEALESTQRAARAGDDEALRAHMLEALRFAPQGPGLFRKAQRDCVIAEGTHHETELREGTTVFAATQSAMHDDDVVDDPGEFRTDRPRHHYMHFGIGMHECFGRFASTMAIPLIAKALLRREDLERAPGDEGALVKAGPFPESLVRDVSALVHRGPALHDLVGPSAGLQDQAVGGRDVDLERRLADHDLARARRRSD